MTAELLGTETTSSRSLF